MCIYGSFLVFHSQGVYFINTWGGARVWQSMCGSQETTCFVSFYHVGSGNPSQVVRLGPGLFYPWICFVGSLGISYKNLGWASPDVSECQDYTIVCN